MHVHLPLAYKNKPQAAWLFQSLSQHWLFYCIGISIPVILLDNCLPKIFSFADPMLKKSVSRLFHRLLTGRGTRFYATEAKVRQPLSRPVRA